MQKEHPVDRLMRALRGPIIVGMYLCLPVFLLSYGWMARDFVAAVPAWVAVPVVIAHLVTVIGVASLIDRQKERQQSSEHAQSVQLQRTR